MRTGESRTLVRARDGRAAIGLKAVGRRLFVAGGPTGKAFVYSTRTGGAGGRLPARARGRDDTFVNDVAVTDDAAYFTDSRRSVLYVLPRDLSAPRELPLPDIPLLEDNNLNGIVGHARRRDADRRAEQRRRAVAHRRRHGPRRRGSTSAACR